MKKQCGTCLYMRLHKYQKVENVPEPPWCSNSKSPFHWKTVKETDVCDEWADKDAKGLVGRAKKAFRGKSLDS